MAGFLHAIIKEIQKGNLESEIKDLKAKNDRLRSERDALRAERDALQRALSQERAKNNTTQ